MAEFTKTPLLTLIKSKKVTSISKLNFNENGYPYLTFLTKDSKSQNPQHHKQR